ncbi:hypothetical protein J6590_091362 [Homalodisca vitripennis]|nr:hypothetical protein J6590_091362 [Homalodisca vitripennis]
MDAFVHPNDNDDPDDDVAHPPPPSPIGIPHLLEDPVEPIAEPRRRRRAFRRGRRLVLGAVRGRSRARGRGRVRGRGLARGLVQGDQNEHRANPQETIDDQFHRLQGIPVDDDGTVADPGEATCSTCLTNVRTYMIVPCSHILFCGPCVRLHRQGMRNEAGVLMNFVVCPNCRIKIMRMRSQWQLAGSFGEQSPVSTLWVKESERDCVVIVGLQLLVRLQTTPPLVERGWVRLVLVNRCRLQPASGLATFTRRHGKHSTKFHSGVTRFKASLY